MASGVPLEGAADPRVDHGRQRVAVGPVVGGLAHRVGGFGVARVVQRFGFGVDGRAVVRVGPEGPVERGVHLGLVVALLVGEGEGEPVVGVVRLTLGGPPRQLDGVGQLIGLGQRQGRLAHELGVVPIMLKGLAVVPASRDPVLALEGFTAKLRVVGDRLAGGHGAS